MKEYYWIDSPIGILTLGQEEDYITDLTFGQEGGVFLDQPTSLMEELIKQLEEYFAGQRQTFEIPLKEAGTDFQKSVWKALREIPYGETQSYKQIAEAVGNPKAARAVGMANNRNPISVLTP